MFDRPLVRFFLNSVWPLLIVLLLLSIGLNAFFLLLDRFSALPKAQQNISSVPAVPTDDSFARGPEAFGRVMRGFPEKTQGSAKDSTPPVRSYVRGTVALPTMPATMQLYRDQGFEIDRTLVENVFRGLRVPREVSTLAGFTKSLTLRSVDSSVAVTLDAERRILTVTRTAPSSIASATSPADDIEVSAIAREFAESLGIDLQTFGTPTVTDIRDAQGNTKTVVVWYATFDSLPLFDADLQHIERLSVQVHRQFRRASSLRLSLLQPGSLVRSAYPIAPSTVIDHSLASGGLLPIAKSLSGTPVIAEFSSFDLAYMVIAPDKEFPLYIVPVLRAEWSMKPTCKGCVLATFATFVPALDPSTFAWTRSTVSLTPSSSSTSSSSSVAQSSSRSSPASVR